MGAFETPSSAVLKRIIFLHKASETYLVADGYRGREIKTAIRDFFRAAAGKEAAIPRGAVGGVVMYLPKTSLAAYVGHDGLMDFHIDDTFKAEDKEKREAIVLACASKAYFTDGLRATEAQPLLWTTGLMAPEAYTLEAALDGWFAGETGEQIRGRAAEAYAKYQRISVMAARRLFVSGW